MLLYYVSKVVDYMLKDRLFLIRKEKGLTQAHMAKILNVSRQAYNHYETGQRIPPTDAITQLANYFNVSTDYLLGADKQHKPKVRGIRIPVLGEVQAGIPIEAIEDIIDYEEIDEQMAAQGDFFALQVRGDSMEPKFSQGDVVIVRQQTTVDSGNIAIMLVNGDSATIKKFMRHDNGISLIALNQAYAPMFYTNKEVEEFPIICLGKVVELRAKF